MQRDLTFTRVWGQVSRILNTSPIEYVSTGKYIFFPKMRKKIFGCTDSANSFSIIFLELLTVSNVQVEIGKVKNILQCT